GFEVEVGQNIRDSFRISIYSSKLGELLFEESVVDLDVLFASVDVFFKGLLLPVYDLRFRNTELYTVVFETVASPAMIYVEAKKKSVNNQARSFDTNDTFKIREVP